jgi:hypothetical protein
MKKIAEFMINKVDHPLCQECPKYNECTATCIAIEVLVQLAKLSPFKYVETLPILRKQLDLENSFDV